MRTLWVLVLTCSCIFCACNRATETQQTQVSVIENDYLRLLDDLTALMSVSNQEPAIVLENVRKYVNGSRDAASGMLNKLNQEVLNMSPDERVAWRRSAQPRTEAALERFANAQLQLQKRMSEAQKWELGEILALLR